MGEISSELAYVHVISQQRLYGLAKCVYRYSPPMGELRRRILWCLGLAP